MAEFRRTDPLKTPSLVIPSQDKSESNYWKSYKNPVFVKSYAAIDSIHFSGSSPYRYAVTTGTKVQIYSPKTARVVKTISRFKETARSGNIREDGKLVVAGDDSGTVQVFDINSRAVLRTYKNGKLPVHCTKFSPHPHTTVLATSDDTSVRLYDLSTGDTLSYFSEHEDYVRTASFASTSSSLVLSGGYDSTVRLWDSRQGESNRQARCMDHGHPVECVLVHPSGSIAISAGGPIIRVWDLLSGSKECIKELSNHQKTITSLAWNGDATRLLSGGLDGLVKVYQTDRGIWTVGHTMRFGGQVLSLGVSPDDTNLVAGNGDGSLCIRKRTLTASEIAEKKTLASQGGRMRIDTSIEEGKGTTKIHTGGELDALSGSSTWETDEDEQQKKEIEVRAPRSRNKKLKEWDKMLKSFRHADALDAALKPGTPQTVTFAVMSELMHRNALDIALSGRNDVSLEPILEFLFKYVTDPRFATLVFDVMNILIDLYTPVLGQSRLIDESLKRFHEKIKKEMGLQDDLVEIKGQLDMLVSANSRL